MGRNRATGGKVRWKSVSKQATWGTPGRRAADGLDQGQLAGHVDRVDGRNAPQVGDNGGRQQFRLDVVRSVVNEPVPDGGDVRQVAFGIEPVEQFADDPGGVSRPQPGLGVGDPQDGGRLPDPARPCRRRPARAAGSKTANLTLDDPPLRARTDGPRGGVGGWSDIGVKTHWGPGRQSPAARDHPGWPAPGGRTLGLPGRRAGYRPGRGSGKLVSRPHAIPGLTVTRLLGLVAGLLAFPATAADGPLAGLPSKPGPHVEKIKALGDNEWLNLGPPAADPKWGRARGRSWGSNMPAVARPARRVRLRRGRPRATSSRTAGT